MHRPNRAFKRPMYSIATIEEKLLGPNGCHLLSPQGQASTNVNSTSSWIGFKVRYMYRLMMISAYLGTVTVEANIDHDRKLIALLNKWRDHGLRLSAKKLQQFKINSVTSMEHKLTDKGVEPDPLKVEAINITRQSSCSTFLNVS